MLTQRRDRVGLLVVRIWFEPGRSTGLRARISHTLDISEQGVVTTVAAPEEICAAVRGWLEGFLERVDADSQPPM